MAGRWRRVGQRVRRAWRRFRAPAATPRPDRDSGVPAEWLDYVRARDPEWFDIAAPGRGADAIPSTPARAQPAPGASGAGGRSDASHPDRMAVPSDGGHRRPGPGPAPGDAQDPGTTDRRVLPALSTWSPRHSADETGRVAPRRLPWSPPRPVAERREERPRSGDTQKRAEETPAREERTGHPHPERGRVRLSAARTTSRTPPTTDRAEAGSPASAAASRDRSSPAGPWPQVPTPASPPVPAPSPAVAGEPWRPVAPRPAAEAPWPDLGRSAEPGAVRSADPAPPQAVAQPAGGLRAATTGADLHRAHHDPWPQLPDPRWDPPRATLAALAWSTAGEASDALAAEQRIR